MQITGIIIFVLCMWMRYDWDFKVYVYKLEMYQVWTGIYVLIVVSAFVILVSFIGCCGAVTENPTILGMVRHFNVQTSHMPVIDSSIADVLFFAVRSCITRVSCPGNSWFGLSVR